MAILITGGAGYIGSHTCVELLGAGEEIVVLDNFYNSKPEAVERIRALAGKDFRFYEADMCDAAAMEKIFAENTIEAVIHFAGYKAVAESVQKPLLYFANNLGGTFTLLNTMERHGCKKLIFSSSATVYGIPETVPVREDFPLSAINPYGRTKLMIEDMCRDLCAADPAWSVALLRYFNPIGAHPSGKLGEDPNGIPNNLMPIIINVATGKQEKLKVFGDDYPTPDGTCIRDYIHVVDLALGHLAALKSVRERKGAIPYNLGTGNGYSVLEIIRTFERANGLTLPYEIAPRRAGDAPECYCVPEKAKAELGWTAKLGLEEMCRDSWNYARNAGK
ncbi:MAG: UDP-glucose 4-epimerase GalE [Bacteroides sp.]|nr:UDP-glucose 4-epimerase GalE [Eubacterium sp.]MCM1418841.1 UDP-glucose 4-epimerase GalE [Roseburia sp.]MCM1462888.1 UDP-glucose 4-epimerase GalE [Bacteroides sp.]